MKKYLILLCAALVFISCDSTYQYTDYSFIILSSGTIQFNGFKDVPKERKQDISRTVYIPEFIYGRKVTHIGSSAFANCSNLTSIVMPDTITHIGYRAFSYSGITSITIPKNVTKIEDWAFYGCKSLTRVIFEEPNGWKAGSHTLSLINPQQNAVYLKSTYYSDDWERR